MKKIIAYSATSAIAALFIWYCCLWAFDFERMLNGLASLLFILATSRSMLITSAVVTVLLIASNACYAIGWVLAWLRAGEEVPTPEQYWKLEQDDARSRGQ